MKPTTETMQHVIKLVKQAVGYDDLSQEEQRPFDAVFCAALEAMAARKVFENMGYKDGIVSNGLSAPRTLH